MAPDEIYDKSKSLREKIMYALSIMKKANAREVAAEIMELDEISTEDGVEDISIDIASELDKLHEEGMVTKLKEHSQKPRYRLIERS